MPDASESFNIEFKQTHTHVYARTRYVYIYIYIYYTPKPLPVQSVLPLTLCLFKHTLLFLITSLLILPY
jgi:hypothetical protein